jgi:proline racemase
VIHVIRTIDAHVGGQSLRLIVEGAPRPVGATITQQSSWLRRHADHIRRAVVLEPRGHVDMRAAQLTDPHTPGVHAAIVFMGADGYPAMSGHGIIAATTIAIERALFYSRDALEGDVRLAFETAAGVVQARARVEDRGGKPRVDSVAVTNVPAFVFGAGQPVKLDGRDLRVDIAFGGVFYAIVDTEAVGIPLNASRLADFRRLAIGLTRAVNESCDVRHPVLPTLKDVTGVVFTGPAVDPESHLRTITVSSSGGVNLSPSGTGMSAVMSVLDAMGLLPDEGPFVQEGLSGSLFRGRAVSRTVVGELPAISTEVAGTAWITGEHTFLLDDDDPFREGFTL